MDGTCKGWLWMNYKVKIKISEELKYKKLKIVISYAQISFVFSKYLRDIDKIFSATLLVLVYSEGWYMLRNV